MSIFRKLGCALIGWKPEILKECGEASVKMYKKLLSAICIMSMLWGTIGYVFAGRYIGIESWWGRAIVAFAFIVIIVSIERIIILQIGHNKWVYSFRMVLAICMALLGSFIFDQVIFKNDLESAIKMNREENTIPKIAASRKQTLETTINEYNSKIDSLGKVNTDLYAEIDRKPFSRVPTLDKKQQVTGIDSVGKPIITTTTSISEQLIENPKKALVKANQQLIDRYHNELEVYNQKLQDVDNEVRSEYLDSNNPNYVSIGFMEELDVSIDVIFKSWITIVFWVILFIFMMMLELFVVSIKMGETCDYDLIVRHQLHMKELQLKNAERIATKDFVLSKEENNVGITTNNNETI